ncbi:MAG: glycogen/starch/alpha-glucan phosphorylase [Clostridia bacterium]|nr:glycogen/starch/alpha-glucan phosphorylase [Clostridia bacterium]MBR4459396.1 glycogen/starch/alpha-glucan phosphorylase [Clostridia bacterium]
MPTTRFDKESIKQSIIGKLQRYNGRSIQDATEQQIYKAVASTVRDQIMQKYTAAREERKVSQAKRLYYLSVEFLMGRSMYCNMLNLVSTKEYREALSELGVDIDRVLKEEPEPGLGNGGLGRLAACFLDSLSSLDLPAMGCTIRYEYGLFRQKIVDGQQVELPDSWLDNGNVWEMAVMEDACEVHFGGHVDVEKDENDEPHFIHRDYYTVEAVPYDMPIVGYDTSTVNTLRMWSARSPKRLDLTSFGQGKYAQASEEIELAEVISKVLYPEDNHYEGKMLRLKQHYFFTSATLQYIIRDFKKQYGNDFSLLPEKVVIHINDTHPGMAIPELMRLLIDQEGLGWDEAEAITRRTVAYTNHTIMAEALEKWPEAMVKQQLPRIYQILEEMNRRLCAKLWDFFPGEWERIANMAIISYGQVHMANLCVAESFSVNGVSKLHGDILKADTFHDFNLVMPEKFSAVTNGITHRRWLMSCNPKLTDLICDAIGTAWIREPERLSELRPFADDKAFREKFAAVKLENKKRLAKLVKDRQNIDVDPTFMFDAQSKRLHEYKRQTMNALHILVLYNRIVNDPTFEMQPRVFFFGAKASPGYYRAKQTIRFINAISRLVAAHPRASKMLQVVFLENYDVSTAEVLIPAAEVSEQISTASKEASGTGCMKYMMNGAITIGTMDGANVEMYEQVGQDNIYIFGMRADTVRNMYKENNYNPMTIFETNQEIRQAMTQMIDGTLFPDNTGVLQDLYHSLLLGGNGAMADSYFVLKDFGSYSMAQRRLVADYADFDKWQKMAVINTAMSGVFSSDRTIREYNDWIWHLEPLKRSK